MDNNRNLEQIEGYLNELLKGSPDFFLVKSKIKPTNNIKLYLDSDKGIRVEDCIQFNRQLRKKIEEENLFGEEDFSLEVSSPGVDEPLLLHRQYVKNIGRTLLVELQDGTQAEGDLKNVADENITLEITEGKGKKAVITTRDIPFDQIKKSTIQIKF